VLVDCVVYCAWYSVLFRGAVFFRTRCSCHKQVISQLRDVTCHIGSTVLPATRHKWTHPALIPARQAGIRLIYHRGMEGWVDLGDRLHIPRCFTRPQTVTHTSTNPTVHGREWNSGPDDHKSDAVSSTTLPSYYVIHASSFNERTW